MLSIILGGCANEGMLRYPANSLLTESQAASKNQALPKIVHASQDNANHQMLYTVQPGDNIYLIAWAFNKDDQALIELNNLKPPYQLKAGEKILLQVAAKAWQKSDPAMTAPLANERTVAPNDQVKVTIEQSEQLEQAAEEPAMLKIKEIVASKPAVTTKAQQLQLTNMPVSAVTSTTTYWAWPIVPCRIGQEFKQHHVQKGMELLGEYGQNIYAACDGKVVYSGNSINYFDNLIIIKHDRYLMSAYGYNAKNLVHVGQTVTRGQKIAVMGYHHNRPTLYFEVRKQGKPIDPATLLPHPNR